MTRQSDFGALMYAGAYQNQITKTIKQDYLIIQISVLIVRYTI